MCGNGKSKSKAAGADRALLCSKWDSFGFALYSKWVMNQHLQDLQKDGKLNEACLFPFQRGKTLRLRVKLECLSLQFNIVFA